MVELSLDPLYISLLGSIHSPKWFSDLARTLPWVLHDLLPISPHSCQGSRASALGQLRVLNVLTDSYHLDAFLPQQPLVFLLRTLGGHEGIFGYAT